MPGHEEESIYDKSETIAVFSGIFQSIAQFSIEPRSFTAEGNRIACAVPSLAHSS